MGFRFSPSHINKSIKQERGMGDGFFGDGVDGQWQSGGGRHRGVLWQHKALGSSKAPLVKA